MTRVPTFGFSAFLGMLFLNERPQRSKIKKRLLPSRSGGKDYHLPFRQAAQRLLTEGKPIEEVISSLQNIRNASQRQSAIDGINRLSEWQVFKTHERLKFGPAIYESPNSVFRVRFDPDFGFDLGGRHTAIQIWNNKASISPRSCPGAWCSSGAGRAFRTKPGIDQLAAGRLMSGSSLIAAMVSSVM